MNRTNLRLALALALAAGCSASPSVDDMAPPKRDLAKPGGSPDLAMDPGKADLAKPAGEDLAQPPGEDAGEEVGEDAGVAEDGGILPEEDLAMAPADLAMAKQDLAGAKDLAMPKPDGGGMMGGTAKLASGTVGLYGVTDDGWAVYYDNASKSLSAVSLAGGAPKKILNTINPDTAYVRVRHKVVFVWPTPNMNTRVGPLHLWTATAGTKQASFYSVAARGFDASEDGKSVVYTYNTNNAGTVTEIRAATPDLASQKTIVLHVGNPVGNAQTCAPLAAITGKWALVAACQENMTTGYIFSSDLVGGATKLLVMGGPPFFATDKAPTVVFAANAQNGVVVPIAGGAATTIDAKVAFGAVTSDGSAVIYRTTAGALKRSPVKAPKPVQLVGSGVNGFMSLSPDQKWVLYYGNRDGNTGFTDLFLASTETPGAPTTLEGTRTAAIYGSGFTADSSRALWFKGVDPMTETGTLTARTIMGGALATVGSKAWAVLATQGSRVVWNDNLKVTAQVPRADLRVGDLAGMGAPTTIQAQADVDWALNQARDRVVYTVSGGGNNGLFVTPLP